MHCRKRSAVFVLLLVLPGRVETLLGQVVHFVTYLWSILSCFQRCKKYENRSRNTRVITVNKVARFCGPLCMSQMCFILCLFTVLNVAVFLSFLCCFLLQIWRIKTYTLKHYTVIRHHVNCFILHITKKQSQLRESNPPSH